ncbi:N-acetyltransferase [Bengtsoniella intestinalis]|uniref:N-acetyltransferase n=1 Tax=Bengtsoniella intestinalis TaxID=3073143 RepID=UPI00391F02F3
MLIEEIGEDATEGMLSCFSCPMNPDVEHFLKHNAIDFAKQGKSQTHLVIQLVNGKPAILGYYTLVNKPITVEKDAIGSKTKEKLIAKFSEDNEALGCYVMALPLIAQLGKNYAEGLNEHLNGIDLLKSACEKIKGIQRDIGGRYTYVECEEKEKLLSFYERNDFVRFGKRDLDAKEQEGHGETYLVQLLKCIKT